jgi:hypothetical protein
MNGGPDYLVSSTRIARFGGGLPVDRERSRILSCSRELVNLHPFV